ncbi:MAG TPA: hypothetical protein VKQ70_09005 [Caulobacteraceae bacterium]|nr:hypothetical protein [Caulobacteraceae bacterium]
MIALVAGGALAAAAMPALAQSYDVNTSQREDGIRSRIDRHADAGDLSYRQATRLRRELSQIVDLDQRYQADGMSDWQIRDLNSRLSLLSSRVNYDVNEGSDY